MGWCCIESLLYCVNIFKMIDTMLGGILVLIGTVGCCGFVYPVGASVRVKKVSLFLLSWFGS